MSRIVQFITIALIFSACPLSAPAQQAGTPPAPNAAYQPMTPVLQPQRRIAAGDTYWETLSFAPDGRTLSYGQSDPGRVNLLDAGTGAALPPIPETNVHNRIPVWSPDGQAVVFATETGVSVANRKGAARAFGGLENVTAASFTHKGDQIVACNEKGQIAFWQLADAAKPPKIITVGHKLSCFDLSPDDAQIAMLDESDGAEMKVVVWDLAAEKTAATFKCDVINSNRSNRPIRFADQGHSLLIQCDLHRFQVWDIKTQKKLREWYVPPMMQLTAISPDGAMVAASELAHKGPQPIYLWESAAGRLLCVLEGPESEAYGIDISADHQHVAAITAEEVLLWTIPPSGPSAGVRRPAAELLTDIWDSDGYDLDDAKVTARLTAEGLAGDALNEARRSAGDGLESIRAFYDLRPDGTGSINAIVTDRSDKKIFPAVPLHWSVVDDQGQVVRVRITEGNGRPYDRTIHFFGADWIGIEFSELVNTDRNSTVWFARMNPVKVATVEQGWIDEIALMKEAIRLLDTVHDAPSGMAIVAPLTALSEKLGKSRTAIAQFMSTGILVQSWPKYRPQVDALTLPLEEAILRIRVHKVLADAVGNALNGLEEEGYYADPKDVTAEQVITRFVKETKAAKEEDVSRSIVITGVVQYVFTGSAATNTNPYLLLTAVGQAADNPYHIKLEISPGTHATEFVRNLKEGTLVRAVGIEREPRYLATTHEIPVSNCIFIEVK